MEQVFSKFPNIACNIFSYLKYDDIKVCRKVLTSWENFIFEQKFLWVEIFLDIINELNSNQTLDFVNIFKGIETKYIKIFVISVVKSHKNWKTNLLDNPLHLLIRHKHIFKLKDLIKIVEKVNSISNLSYSKNSCGFSAIDEYLRVRHLDKYLKLMDSNC